jgi:predicted amidohydrolase
MDCLLGQPEANRSKIIDQIRAAAQRGAKLVAFPECALTGYAFESLEEAVPFTESIDGPTSQAIAKVCNQEDVYAAVGFIERDGDQFYNSVMLVGPEGVAGSYRKTHLPFIGIDRFLSQGDRPFEVFDLPFGKIGLNICYDISFPEPARILKLLGAQVSYCRRIGRLRRGARPNSWLIRGRSKIIFFTLRLIVWVLNADGSLSVRAK